jgi:SAM-dependent methyltransferase
MKESVSTTVKVSNDLKYTNCPLCTSQKIKKVGDIHYEHPILYSSQEIEVERTPELWQCTSCSSAFVQNAIHESDSIALYSSGNAVERWKNYSTFAQGKTVLAVETLERYLKPGINILDVGCNSGEFLDFAKQKGSTTFGVEYSTESQKFLKQKGHQVFSNLQEVKIQFQIITAFDLVEHLYDFKGFLEWCLQHLTPDGCLIILTGDIQSLPSKVMGSAWWYVSFPEHIVFPAQKYFQSSRQWKISEWKPTYAGPWYEQSMLNALRNTRILLKQGNKYRGVPSFVPDHILAVLQPSIHQANG